MATQYAAESGVVSAINTQQGEVTTTADWAFLTVKLSGTAGGDNYLWIGTGGSGMLLEPGDIAGPLLVPPKTQVKVTTTSTSSVSWGYYLATIPGNALLGAIMYAAGYLNVIACTMSPEGVDAVTRELKRMGL